MGRFEYKAVVEGVPEALASKLTQLSEDGWEPCGDLVLAKDGRLVLLVRRTPRLKTGIRIKDN